MTFFLNIFSFSLEFLTFLRPSSERIFSQKIHNSAERSSITQLPIYQNTYFRCAPLLPKLILTNFRFPPRNQTTTVTKHSYLTNPPARSTNPRHRNRTSVPVLPVSVNSRQRVHRPRNHTATTKKDSFFLSQLGTKPRVNANYAPPTTSNP